MATIKILSYENKNYITDIDIFPYRNNIVDGRKWDGIFGIVDRDIERNICYAREKTIKGIENLKESSYIQV